MLWQMTRRGRTRRRHIRGRGADGKWRDLTVEPRKTGDSELDELWQMSFGEFEKIVEDPEHPLHGKALEVQREAIKPITDALSELTRPITESLAKSFDFSSFSKAIAPKIDFSSVLPKMDASSWFAKMLPETSALSIPGGSVDLATSLSAPSIPASEVMSPVLNHRIRIGTWGPIRSSGSTLPRTDPLFAPNTCPHVHPQDEGLACPALTSVDTDCPPGAAANTRPSRRWHLKNRVVVAGQRLNPRCERAALSRRQRGLSLNPW